MTAEQLREEIRLLTLKEVTRLMALLESDSDWVELRQELEKRK